MYCNLIGQQFAAGREIASILPPHVPVYLIREPSNPYDPNAIQVWADKEHFGDEPIKEHALKGAYVRLGFIKREQAAELAPEMDRVGHSGIKALHVFEGLFEAVLPKFKIARIVEGAIDPSTATPEEYETRAEAEAAVDDHQTKLSEAWGIIEPM